MSSPLTFSCASCHVAIAVSPTFHVGLPFCCAGCVAGGPCTCSYDEDPSDDPAETHDEPALVDDRGSLVGAAR